LEQVALSFLMAGLVGCGQSDIARPDLEISTEPARLKVLREQRKAECAGLGDVLCDRVADATRKRFYGNGKVPYTPSEVPPKF